MSSTDEQNKKRPDRPAGCDNTEPPAKRKRDDECEEKEDHKSTLPPHMINYDLVEAERAERMRNIPDDEIAMLNAAEADMFAATFPPGRAIYDVPDAGKIIAKASIRWRVAAHHAATAIIEPTLEEKRVSEMIAAFSASVTSPIAPEVTAKQIQTKKKTIRVWMKNIAQYLHHACAMENM